VKLNFQYAHHSHKESEDRSISSASQGLTAFDAFDWGHEVEKANELQKCSPTLSLLIAVKDHMIWVSAYGDKNDPKFVSECHFPGEISGFLGFGKKQGIVNLHTDSFSKAQAREAISLFITNSEKELRSFYKNA
jgi:hypothetical protein